MKTKLRSFAIIILLAWLLTSVIPVAAGVIKTPVAGTHWITGVFVPPEYSEWWAGDENFHFRNLLTYWEQTFDDPRLSGYAQTMVNSYQKFVDGDLSVQHVWGTSEIYADSAYLNLTWRCRYTGKFDVEGKRIKVWCKGERELAGLIANLDFYCPSLDYSIYDVTGEIIQPGSE